MGKITVKEQTTFNAKSDFWWRLWQLWDPLRRAVITANGDKEGTEGLGGGSWQFPWAEHSSPGVGEGRRKSRRLWRCRDFAASAGRGPDGLNITTRAGPLGARGPRWNSFQDRGLEGCQGMVSGCRGSR